MKCNPWGKEPAELSIEELEKHALVSNRNRCKCKTCYTCRCAIELISRKDDIPAGAFNDYMKGF